MTIVQLHTYQGETFGFCNNLIRADDLYYFFGVASDRAFRRSLQTKLDCRNGTRLIQIPTRQGFEAKQFLNTSQVYIFLRSLLEEQKIDIGAFHRFLEWHHNIIDNGDEIWFSESKERRLQEQLILLASFSNTRLIQENTALSLPGSSEKTRRFDLVQFINRTNTVRIRELKAQKVSLRDVVKTLEEKQYKLTAEKKWPNKNIELVFSSLDGIEEDAALFIADLEKVWFEPIQELSIRLYMKALEKTPLEGWRYFQNNVVNRFLEILPDRPSLMAAEEDLKKYKQRRNRP